MRVIIGSFERKPFRRVTVTTSQLQVELELDVDSQARTPPSTIQIAFDAFELSLNLRGCGWNWSAGVKIPPETRPTSSTGAFNILTFTSLILHLVVFDVFHYSIQWFAPLTIGSANGGSIFDPSMPYAQRYLRSSAITFLSGLTIYCAIQVGYHMCTLLGVLVFRQHISQWPPIFKDPWFATSLNELWAERWHQLFRHNFISLGGKPMAWLMGRTGGILGSFFMSGLFHHFGLWGMGNGSDFPRVVGFFMMMGIGTIMEHTFKMFTGHRVGGFFGWMWMFIWGLGWAHILVEAWATRGLIGSAFIPDPLRPSFNIFGPLP
jgi:Membrane bound O-acyl transferase family